MNYLKQLLQQLEVFDVSDSASVTIFANDGDPAIVHLKQGTKLLILMQNEDLSALNIIKVIDM